VYFCSKILVIVNKVYLSLGTNLGDRIKLLAKATSLIKARIGMVIKSSSIYETEPWGFHSDNLFLNQVLLVETTSQPKIVLEEIQAIETEMGRTRKFPTYESRNIDIDILFYDDLIVKENSLEIPHPRLHERNFILIPFTEIAPEFIHPLFKLNIKKLQRTCLDRSSIRIFNDCLDKKKRL